MAHQQQQLAQSVNCSLDDIDLTALKVSCQPPAAPPPPQASSNMHNNKIPKKTVEKTLKVAARCGHVCMNLYYFFNSISAFAAYHQHLNNLLPHPTPSYSHSQQIHFQSNRLSISNITKNIIQ